MERKLNAKVGQEIAITKAERIFAKKNRGDDMSAIFLGLTLSFRVCLHVVCQQGLQVFKIYKKYKFMGI